MASFSDRFRREACPEDNEADIICVDGKSMRGTVLHNGRNLDIVSAYSCNSGITLATEACQEKSNGITAVPVLLDRLDITGQIITADAMSMQKEIVDKIRAKGADFVIELKANQRSLRYGIEDRIRNATPVHTYTDGPVLEHGRIEERTYNIYDGLTLIADKDKWNGSMTVVESVSRTIRKATGACTVERRLYVSSLPTDDIRLKYIPRKHWSIESMHWSLDYNLQQDRIKRKGMTAARNLDTIQRIVLAIFSVWRSRRKKRSDKAKGNAELMRYVSMSFTKLMLILFQK